ncbi:MAG: DUF3500 domain-containing protein [Chloroflexota bacterium]
MTRARRATPLRAIALTLSAVALLGGPAGAQSPAASPTTAGGATAGGATAADATPAIVAAADAFLATLSAEQQDAVRFDWADEAQKSRWSNLPQGLFQRDGLMWGDLTAEQQDAWLALMQATLSDEGYQRVLAEWNGDATLAASGGGGQLQFGTQYYWVAIIGEPSETDPWQWQWGGHHVTVNATIAGTELSLTPSFIGVQPATYTDPGGQTVRPLGDIEDEAFALVDSLTAEQRAVAILGDTPIDLVLGPGEDGRVIEAEGLPASQMTAEQRAAFLALIEEYTGLANDEDAAVRDARIEADLDDTSFAWYGPTEPGSAMYFRITGPTIVIEYSPQQMGGDASQHIHGIYRDPTNDYGAAITG